MKKVLITLDYDPSPHKLAETGFSIAKTLGLGITLLAALRPNTGKNRVIQPVKTRYSFRSNKN